MGAPLVDRRREQDPSPQDPRRQDDAQQDAGSALKQPAAVASPNCSICSRRDGLAASISG